MKRLTRAALAFVMYFVLAGIVLTLGIGESIEGWLLGGAVAVTYALITLTDRFHRRRETA